MLAGGKRVLFFQAEDGIRDYKVTGVQTCALPISNRVAASGISAAVVARKQRWPSGDVAAVGVAAVIAARVAIAAVIVARVAAVVAPTSAYIGAASPSP